jgi:hypothetical protein
MRIKRIDSFSAFTVRFFLMALLPALAPSTIWAQGFAEGVVFHDLNRNGVRDPGEPGLRGVRVSNQREVVKTDWRGRWRLPSAEDTIFFVVKPRGWMTAVNQHMLPQFYYIHKPHGSPPLKYEGVAPTGPLPKSIDFALYPQKEPKEFKAIFFADPQPRNIREVEYIAHDVIEELIGTDAKFGVTLGDIVFDDLDLFEPLNASIALIGIPWYNVLGNHDINFDAVDDKHSDETFERVYGPNYYSFDYGPVHFIVLDDVVWGGREPEGTGRYTGGLGPDQIEFVKNNLSFVPQNQLVVFMMHIPLPGVADREELFRVFEMRPYTLSISGHTHWQEHRFITREDGWHGPEPHHHIINVTVSGSWWSGLPDERGIPHTLMRDGAPNGYAIATFSDRKAKFDFKAARRPADYQMAIHAPEQVTVSQAAQTPVYVNVFAGSERSTVEMRIGSEQWISLAQVREEDPYFVRLKEYEAQQAPLPPYRKLPQPMKSPHLWKGPLPAGLRPGVQLISVRTTDMYGRTFEDRRIITVLPDEPAGHTHSHPHAHPH